MNKDKVDTGAGGRRDELAAMFRPIAIPEVVAAQLMLTMGFGANVSKRQSCEPRLPLTEVKSD